jgi:hypothetical protein
MLDNGEQLTPLHPSNLKQHFYPQGHIAEVLRLSLPFHTEFTPEHIARL